MLLIALLMMSRVRYPSGKNLNLQTQMRLRPFALVLAFLFVAYFLKEYALLAACLGYIFFGLIRHWRRPAAASPSARPDNL
jgi:CDP-diacylglycerol--serine O-phosphatidyltransferase